jgi:hypothetical protein
MTNRPPVRAWLTLALVWAFFAFCRPAVAQTTVFSETFDPLSSGANVQLGWLAGDAASNSSVAVVPGVGVGNTSAMRVVNNAPAGTSGYSVVGAQYQIYPSGNTSANPADYTLAFDAKSTGGNFRVEVQLWSGMYFGGTQVVDLTAPSALAPGSSFTHYSLNLSNFTGTDIGVGMSGKTWQFNFPFNGNGPTPYTNILYLDNLTLSMATNSSSGASNAPVIIAVDAQANRNPISPLIYGTAFASSNQLADLNFTLNRSGGNNETRYNWQINAHNLDFDYYFESYPEADPTPGGAADSLIADSKNGGAQPLITVPMIGWAPKLGMGRSILSSYSASKYGPQTSVDPYHPDSGNGIGTNSATHTSWLITTNNPNDANIPVDAPFEEGYVQHLIGKWGSSTNGGVKYYLMDNEHTLWFSTHQDVHHTGTTMREILTNIIAYASMVKSNDPNALVAAPEEWGWPGYLYSGFDQQWSGLNKDYNIAHYPDRQTNGGWDYMPWLLSQLYQHDTNSGRRLLDYFTLHCYPQEGSVSSSDASAATALLRNQSTRVFWDTNYLDPSWINNVIMLIPRMKSWATGYYPGTRIGVTEYNWGAESDINGAVAQADILGIFGREGLDLATRWTTPAMNTPTYLAMKIYRNYDGNKSTFGDTSVSVQTANVDNVSAFAALRSRDGALTVMVINKQLSTPAALNVTVTNFLAGGTVQAWQLTSANVITRLADSTLSGGAITNVAPAESITLFVLPPGIPPPAPQLKAASGSGPDAFNIWLTGTAGQRYLIQFSTDLKTWSPVATNTLTTSSNRFVFDLTDTSRFFRARWWP